MDALKNAWAKVEDYWAKAFGFVGAHPKTTVVIILALVAARIFLP